jgi:tripartite-type tricarboxylate transporter receptor subunit TctC
MRALRWGFVLVALVCGLSNAASAEDKFPNRPIKFVVGFLAGGPTDTIARLMCDYLAAHIGQPCVVENKTGQGGMLAAQAVVNSPADGYTLLFVAPNNFIGNSLYKNLSFVHVRDTAPIAGIMKVTNIMVVPPSLPARTVAEFIALAKSKPGELTYASSGNGTSVHMSAELFKMMANLNMVHVPYRGSAGIYPDLLTGKVHVLFDNLPGSIQFVKTGKLRALGVTSATRSTALPDVPTVAETLPGYEASVFYGAAGPKGMPPQVVEFLNKAFNDAVSDPKVRERIAQLGGEPMPMTPAQFGKLTQDETDKWAKVVKAANLSVE